MEISGIIHCHSTYSYDAKLSLAELRELFIQKGLSFVCMTEHTDELTQDRAMAFVAECDRLSDTVFRFIPGFEVPYKVSAEGKENARGHQHAHILMIGMRAFHDIYAPTIDILRRWTQEASFVVLAHPVRNLFQVDDGLLEEIDALEVWNQQYEGKRVPRTRSLSLLNMLRAKKPELIATGGVDFHRREHYGAPVVTMSVDQLDEPSIIEKLKTGAFIVSSPQAHFYGTLPDIDEKMRAHRLESFISVTIIVLGKLVNATLASLGLSLPRSWKQAIRKKL